MIARYFHLTVQKVFFWERQSEHRYSHIPNVEGYFHVDLAPVGCLTLSYKTVLIFSGSAEDMITPDKPLTLNFSISII